MTPRQARHTPAQRALLADHRCVECGQPSEMRRPQRTDPPGAAALWYDTCRACRDDAYRHRTGPSANGYQGAGASSVGREYHRRLGYGSGEPR